MTSITRIHWSEVPGGALQRFAIWPEPVDHDACFAAAGFHGFADTDNQWDTDFEAFVDRLVGALEQHGAARLVAGDLPVRQVGLFRRAEQGSLQDALRLAAMDDQYRLCRIEFGEPPRAWVTTSDGHPIFWVELAEPEAFQAVFVKAANGLPCTKTVLSWESLLPSSVQP